MRVSTRTLRMSRLSSIGRLAAPAMALCLGVMACGKGRSAGPHHRERTPVQDVNCREPLQPRAYLYPAENRTDYGPDDPKKDGCALLVPDHLFCCPDAPRPADR
jgi:hypothetical protein